jgi:hypothetical protein
MHSLIETLLKLILPGVIDCLPLFPLRSSFIDAAENEGSAAGWAWMKVEAELMTMTIGLSARQFHCPLTFTTLQFILKY